jgi:hypothetical protein
MSEQLITSNRISDFPKLFSKRTSNPLCGIFRTGGFLSLLGSLALLLPMPTPGQSSSDFGEARIACAEGLGQQAVERARAGGLNRGLADLCVTALNSTAADGKLLEIYSQTSEAQARLLIKHFTDSAQLSTGPFHADGTPVEMLKKGELIPSLAFDAGFTQSFLEKQKTPSVSMSSAELKRTTEGCLSQTQSLAICVDAGQIQGALAYQTSNAFSNNNAPSTPTTGSQGPDKAQIKALVDRKFQIWSQSWSWDRYLPGSVQITGLDCNGQCRASGQFSFNRMGAIHTIAFVAFLSSESDGKYSIGRLCYNDDTSGMRECVD